ncbi:hypothetical protein Tco_1063365 [Tanacetum coccineum]
MELCSNLQQMVLDLETTNTTQGNEIASLRRRVKKLEKKNRSRTHKFKRIYRVGSSRRVESFEDEGLGEEDASKQGRITDIDANKDIYLVNVHTDEDMFGVSDLHGDEVIVDNVDIVKTVEETRSVVEEVTVDIEKAKLVSAAEEIVNVAATTVSTASTILVSAAIATTTTTATITDVKVTLAQALTELKSAKPKANKVVIQEPEQVKPMKRLEQIRLDEELAFKLQDKEEEERAKIEADYQLAQRLQAQEQEELTDDEKTRLTKLVEKSSKKAEVMEESSMKAAAKIAQESSSKRAGEEMEQESSKKQKVEEDKESEELKQCLEIVPDDGDDVTIDATPLSTKSPTIFVTPPFFTYSSGS